MELVKKKKNLKKAGQGSFPKEKAYLKMSEQEERYIKNNKNNNKTLTISIEEPHFKCGFCVICDM